MPKPTRQLPDKLRPYAFHGIDFSGWREGEREAIVDCPFCGRDGKFSVNVATGMARCLTGCITGGDKGGLNTILFIRELHRASEEATRPEQYKELAAQRGLEYPETLIAWGVCCSIITREWLVPGYNVDGKLTQLYRYCRAGNNGKATLLATPTLSHGLFGRNLYDPSCVEVNLAEGPWDGMRFWEKLRTTKVGENGEWVESSSPQSSLLAGSSVLATPGCNTFNESWSTLFADRTTNILFDNDYPREHPTSGKVIEPAGFAGARRAVRLLSGSAKPPATINWLAWGVQGYDAGLPDGYDVRDALASDTLESLIERIEEVPHEWLNGASNGNGKASGGGAIEPEYCDNYRTLIQAWRKAMKWTDGLDHALSAMLSSIASVQCPGDQLWIKVISPAATGKSILCEAMSVNKKYVLAKSKIKGFHSGFKSVEERGKDTSLLTQLNNKTLVLKDGDTLLQMPNLGEILSEGRDIYDRVSRSHYRNEQGRDYDNVNMTWILCGTNSLRSIDQSELGERFLDIVIMDQIDDELEDEILMRVAHREERNLSLESDDGVVIDPDMRLAMQLTGGYINYLKANISKRLEEVTFPDSAKRRITRLAKFVAFMRARPSRKQEETAEREFATRLVSQHIRLAKCLAVVLNRKSVDVEVMARVDKVSKDTARGKVLELAKYLFRYRYIGAKTQAIDHEINLEPAKIKALLRFLKQIGVLRLIETEGAPGIRVPKNWALTEPVARLYEEVYREYREDVN